MLPTLTTLSAGTTAALVGQPLSFTANVTLPGRPSVAPTGGTVTFRDGNVSLGTAPVVAGTGIKGYNGDNKQATAANLTTQPTLSTTATASSGVSGSPYPITIHGAADANYTLTYVAGTLSVTPATLTVTAANQSRVYGSSDPPFTAAITGFVNNETLLTSGVGGTPNLTSTDTVASPVGTYTILAAQGTLSAQNYTFSFVSGTLTIVPETITVASVETLSSLESSGNVNVVVGAGGQLTVASPQ